MIEKRDQTSEFAVTLLLPLAFFNITIAANQWRIGDVLIGQVLFWALIGLAWYVSLRARLWKIATLAFLLALVLRAAESFDPQGAVVTVREVALAVLFVVAGARAFGSRFDLLKRQLALFVVISIPIMLLQILGVHSAVMAWNTEAMVGKTLTFVEGVDSIKTIVLEPTLFTTGAETGFNTAQARPVGLSYSNNILAIFISLAAVSGIVYRKHGGIDRIGIAVIVATVLSMSKMAMAGVLILYIASAMTGWPGSRKRGLQGLLVMVMAFGLYGFFFPGLLERGFALRSLAVSTIPRLIAVADGLGFASVGDKILDVWSPGALDIRTNGLYSGFGAIASGPLPLVLLVLLGALLFVYVRRVKSREWNQFVPHISMLLMLVWTQLATFYFVAPSFQILMGFALFPLIERVRPRPRPLPEALDVALPG